VADLKNLPNYTLDDQLSLRERKFCHEYLLNDFDIDRACEALGEKLSHKHKHYLEDERITNYLKNKVKEVEEKFNEKFMRKYEHLDFIRNLAVPMHATTLKGHRPDIAVACIKEMNRMDGHHAAAEVKHEFKRDEDVEKGNAILASLVEEHKKEY
jgi:hypothetical protein